MWPPGQGFEQEHTHIGQAPSAAEAHKPEGQTQNHSPEVTHSLNSCPQWSSMSQHEKPVTFPACESTPGLPDLSRRVKVPNYYQDGYTGDCVGITRAKNNHTQETNAKPKPHFLFHLKPHSQTVPC